MFKQWKELSALPPAVSPSPLQSVNGDFGLTVRYVNPGPGLEQLQEQYLSSVRIHMDVEDLCLSACRRSWSPLVGMRPWLLSLGWQTGVVFCTVAD